MGERLFSVADVLEQGAPMLPGPTRPIVEPNRLFDGEPLRLYDAWLCTTNSDDSQETINSLRRWVRRNTRDSEGRYGEALDTYGVNAIYYAIADGVVEMIQYQILAGLDSKGQIKGNNQHRKRANELIGRLEVLLDYDPEEPIVLPESSVSNRRNLAGIRTFESVENARLLMLKPKYDMLRQILAQKRWPDKRTKNFDSYSEFYAHLGNAILWHMFNADCTRQEKEQLKRRLFEAETMALIFRAIPGSEIDGSWPMVASNRLSIGRYRNAGDSSRTNASLIFPGDDIALPISITQAEQPEDRPGMIIIGRRDLYPADRPMNQRRLGGISLTVGGVLDGVDEIDFLDQRTSFIRHKIAAYYEALLAAKSEDKEVELIIDQNPQLA